MRSTVIRASRHGTDHAAAVRVDGGERLRLRVRSTAIGGDCGVRVEGVVSDLTLRGDVYNDGPGIVVGSGADAQNVRLREFTHRGDGPTVRAHGDATLSGLRPSGVDSLHGGAVDLSGAFVDGLRIRDCAVGGLKQLHSDQRHAEDTILDDTVDGN